MKRSRIAVAVMALYGHQLPFIHMRTYSYLGAGGPMLTIKVV
jgi:hypothetical protein